MTAGGMETRAVGPAMGGVRNDGHDCQAPAA